MTERQRLVVIGNGMAGARLVEEVLARDADKRFEIVVFGDEPYGNYNRILLSDVLIGARDATDIFLNPLDWYVTHDVRLHAGVRVTEIDRPSKTVYGMSGTGVAERYDKLVLATGSRPVVPPMSGLSSNATAGWKEGVFVFRTLDDCRAVIGHASHARRAVVIGGGLLGLEAARGLLQRGLEVHVVHLMPHLMEIQLDGAAGAMLKHSLEALGVHIHLEKRSTAILGDRQVSGVAFADGSHVDCDLVIISAGTRPNADLAASAGLAVERGVVVNDDLTCRHDPDVYAIGECAEHRGRIYGFVAPLWDQAQTLADRLTGQEPDAIYTGSRVSTKLKVMGVELAVMGDKDPSLAGDEVVTYQEPSRGVYKKLIVRDGRLAGAILLGDGLALPDVMQTFERAAPLPENRAEVLFPLAWQGLRLGDIGDMPDSARVCQCNGVTKGAILSAVRGGCSDTQSVCQATRAGSGCGACRTQVQTLVQWALQASPA